MLGAEDPEAWRWELMDHVAAFESSFNAEYGNPNKKSEALNKPRSAICYCCPIIAYCTRVLTLGIGVSGHQCKILHLKT